MRTYLYCEAGFVEKPQWLPNCWVNVVCPDNDDFEFLTKTLNVPESFLNDIACLLYTSHITRQDYPTVIQIDEDGSFLCKFVIKHPVEQSVTLDNNWIPFYIEPGQTLTTVSYTHLDVYKRQGCIHETDSFRPA